MSTPPASEARPPRRERGQVRVAAIMEAGAALFREKGFEAVTMSDIAARSGTAFGSLYRFFPSKEALADALLLRYAERTLDRLHDLAGRAPTMSPSDVAAALVDFMLELQSERSFAITVVEARGADKDRRAKFRAAVRDRIADVLRAALPRLTAANARSTAIVTLHLLKGVAAAGDEPPALRRLLLVHYREVLRSYLLAMDGEPQAAGRADSGR
jgi:AcrR family transcriptional regulator